MRKMVVHQEKIHQSDSSHRVEHLQSYIPPIYRVVVE
jgi:hypothetical protein